MLGVPMPDYPGYNPSIFPNVENFFSSVSMRFAHANIKNQLHLFNEKFQMVEDFDLMKEL